MTFTVPETNFICIYAEKTKQKTIENIFDAMLHFVERDLIIIGEDVITKLNQITDDEFAEHNFTEQFADDFAYAE